MAKLLLDANFLLDFIDSRRPDASYAEVLFCALMRGEHAGVISAQTLKDVYYLVCQLRSEEEARDWVRAFIRAFPVEDLDAEICTIALESDEPDFEDGCIRATAERVPVEFIITRDKRAFARSWVKAYSAREFLELFPPKEGVPA